MTGAIKHDEDKPRIELMPWDAVIAVSEVLTIGAKKYADDNWNQGEGLGQRRVLGAALRHIAKHLLGEDLDGDGTNGTTGKPHLSCAATEILFALSYYLQGKGDDRAKPQQVADLEEMEHAIDTLKETPEHFHNPTLQVPPEAVVIGARKDALPSGVREFLDRDGDLTQVKATSKTGYLWRFKTAMGTWSNRHGDGVYVAEGKDALHYPGLSIIQQICRNF